MIIKEAPLRYFPSYWEAVITNINWKLKSIFSSLVAQKLYFLKTSQELRMLSSVTLNCEVTCNDCLELRVSTVWNDNNFAISISCICLCLWSWSGFASSSLRSNVSKVTNVKDRYLKMSLSLSLSLCLSFLSGHVFSVLITLIKCFNGHKSLGLLFEGIL